jgi:hypothetical protein
VAVHRRTEAKRGRAQHEQIPELLNRTRKGTVNRAWRHDMKNAASVPSKISTGVSEDCIHNGQTHTPYRNKEITFSLVLFTKYAISHTVPRMYVVV